MTYSWDEVVDIVRQRRSAQSVMLQRMIDVQRRYNGEFAIPLPADGQDDRRPMLVAQLINEAIDQPAMRAGSILPSIFCPAVDPASDLSRERASKRRKSMASVLYRSKWNLLSRKVLRHIGGYSSSSVLLIPDEEMEMPKLVVRDPLTSYPDPRAPEDLRPPNNVGYIHQKSAAWLVQRYKTQLLKAYGGPIDVAREGWNTELWDCLEWIDAEQCMLGVMGPTNTTDRLRFSTPNFGVLLHAWENKAGCVPAVVPQVITLDAVISRLHHMIGKIDTMAYLFDLDILASEKAIFPDRYVIGEPNQVPGIVGGTWQDGRSGKTNMLTGVKAIGELHSTPDQGAFQRIQYLERNARVESGTVSAYGGETMGALRTGRGIDSMMGASVDPRVQELQEIVGETLHELACPMFEMFEGYWPTKKYTIFSGWPDEMGHVEFEPLKHFKESHEVVFSYAIPGADASAITVEVGQLAEAKLISKHSARVMHPHIKDVEGQEKLIMVEQLDELSLQVLQQRGMSGGLTPVDAAAIQQALRRGATLDVAIIEADDKAKARQAAQAPPPNEEAGEAASPATMPGMANPGEGNESMPAPGGPQGAPPPGLAAMLGALNQQPDRAGAGTAPVPIGAAP